MGLLAPVLALFPAVVTYLITPVLLSTLQRARASRRNYRGQVIPVGAGFGFVWIGGLFSLFAAAGLALPVAPRNSELTVKYYPFGTLNETILLITAGVFGYAFLGLLDDLLGTRQDSGFRGHLRALREGRLTTGALKAFLGGLLGLGLGGLITGLWFLPPPGAMAPPPALSETTVGMPVFSAAMIHLPAGEGPAFWPLTLSSDMTFGLKLLQALLYGLLIATAANTVNLFDLRPGRAAKVFLLGSFLLTLTQQRVVLWLLSWAGALIGYLPYDLRARAMMGDTGANALGALLGIVSCLALPPLASLLLLFIFISLQVLSECFSFSRFIESNSLLAWLDQWGREENPKPAPVETSK